jgi:thiosulfate/3-mercaptopyruvate sulfurtransferase
MNSKPTRLHWSLVTLIAFSAISPVFSQSSEPWTAKDYKDPAALAATLCDPKAAKPLIFNIGSVQQIKGAILIGPAGAPKNLDKLKEELAKLPKDKEIVIYCGCCPFQRCPNARPALELLKQMKFTNAKLLKLPTSLNDDWISKGYPIE